MKISKLFCILLIVIITLISLSNSYSLAYNSPEETYDLISGDPVIEKDALLNAALKGVKYGELSKVLTADQAFPEAVRLVTKVQPQKTHDLQLDIPVIKSINKGDILLASFYMRTIESTDETGEGQTEFIFEEKKDPYTKSASYLASADGKWKKHYIPFKAVMDHAKDLTHITMRLGYKPQTIEIGGLELWSLGKDFPLNKLPRTNDSYPGQNQDAEWRKEAMERIENIRKADISVQVKDIDGNNIEGASVNVKMSRHAFRFGTAVPASRILNNSAKDNEKFLNTLKETFNTVVLESDMKWVNWENNREKAINAVNWLIDNGFYVRGHNLIWGKYKSMPKDVENLKDAPDSLRDRINNHISEEVPYFIGKIGDWDVINEPVKCDDIRNILGDKEMAEWLKLARQLDPDSKLYINETGILGKDTPVIKQFSSILDTLVENDAPFDGIGIQAHFSQTPCNPADFIKQLDYFAQYGKRLQITEFDMDTFDEQLQGDFTRDILIASFSHPSVDAFLMWGFWDGQHWKSNAPLYRKDWSLKPSGKEWLNLVFKDWWTNISGDTNMDGKYFTRGFLGEYEITASYNGKVKTVSTKVDKGQDNFITIMLD